MAKLGRVIRMQYYDGENWVNFPLERGTQLVVGTEMLQKSGTGRAQRLDKGMKSWSTTITVLVDTPERFMWLIDVWTWPVKRWRLLTEEQQHYTGNAWVTKVSVSAGLNNLVEAQIALTGNGKLERL